MCWSTEVTLAFVLLELGCCAIIAAQGLHGLLLAFGPLVLQEVVQLLLWLEIDRHDPAVGGGTCRINDNPANWTDVFAFEKNASWRRWTRTIRVMLSFAQTPRSAMIEIVELFS